MSESTQLTIRPKASQQLANLIGMEPGAMLDAIKAQCFKCDPSKVSNEMLAAFVSVAAAMEVNPMLPGMLYAYPDGRGGIVPMMGPDGVFKKLAEHPEVDSWETVVYPEDPTQAPTHAVSKIWRRGRDKPLTKTCVLSEWKVGSNPNWATRQRHMLELRALKQNARQIIHGIPFDEDERQMMGEINITPEPAPQPEPEKRPAPPPRQKKGAAAVAEAQKQASNVVEGDFTEAPKTETRAKEPDAATKEPEKKEAPTEKAPEPAPAPAKKEPRTQLRVDEEFEAVCKVIQSSGLMARSKGPKGEMLDPQPSVMASVEGDFAGRVIHINAPGAKVVNTPNGDDVTLPELWQAGTVLRLKLLGRPIPKNPNAPSVKVLSAEKLEATPGNPVTEVE